MKRSFLVVVVVACSSPSKPEVKPPPPPADCVAADRSAAAFEARRGVLMGAIAKGREYRWELLGAGVDPEAARATCKDQSEDLRKLCFEGIAQGYGAAIAQNPSETLVKNAPAELAKIDSASAPIHCRGLGAGLHAGGVTTDKLASLIAGVDARCKNNIVDGYAARAYMVHLKVAKLVPPPTAEQLAAAKLEDACAGLDATWCAFAAGRALTHMYPGDPVAAARGCHGALRGPCLAGIGYVTAYLYEPEDLGHAVEPVSTLTGDDRTAYATGIGMALHWAKRDNPTRLQHSVACVPEAQRQVVQDLEARAQDELPK